MGVVENLTKNMFAVMSFQWWRAWVGVCAGVPEPDAVCGVCVRARLGAPPYAVALASMFGIYVGMSWMSDVPAYYFVLHPVSSALFVYIVLRSMFLTLGRGGVVWRGTFYPLDEFRKGNGVGRTWVAITANPGSATTGLAMYRSRLQRVS